MFARTDWAYVFNTCSYGYALGYHFIQSKSGACNGNFLGIGADMAVRRGEGVMLWRGGVRGVCHVNTSNVSCGYVVNP